MESENKLPTLSQIIEIHILFFQRSDIQHQFLIIICSLVISWFLSKWFWHWLQKTFPQATVFIWGNTPLPPRQYLALLIQNLDFPVIGFLALHLIQIIFVTQNWTRGLLTTAIYLMSLYLVYRFFLASLYAAFPLAAVKQYHYSLLAPLGFLFVVGTIINLSHNLVQIAQLSPFKLFNTPISFGDIFVFIAGIYFWIVIVICLEKLIFNFFRAGTQLDPGTVEVILLLIRYFMIAFGIVIIVGYVGVDGTAVAAITGGLSVGIGFGLQQVVSNFISGFILLFERVLKPGDIIDVQGQTCQVKKLGIRAITVLLLKDNSEKIIPNMTFFTSDVTTYTGSDRLINCSITVGVGYNSKVSEVMDILLKIAHEHPSILKFPTSSVFLTDFGDSSLDFELKFWLDDINIKKRVTSDLSCLILAKFSERNIEIPFPQRDIYIRSE